ncbi:MAG: DUF7619 domain-containing protein [Aureispira sp.]
MSRYVLIYCWSSLFFLLSWQSKAQTTFIPDTLFEARLIQMGIDTDSLVNGQVATSSISGVTHLDVTSVGIHDLTGIQDFAMLKWLNCSNNPLDSLVLIGLSNLEYLRCTHTNIATLDLSGCPNLLRLMLRFNLNLTTINLSNNTVLNNCEIRSCAISQIDLSSNALIHTLSISRLPIVELDLTSLVQLETIHVYLTDLDSVALPNTSSLREIYFIDNKLRQLDVSQNPGLAFLFCGQNRIRTIDVSHNTQLTNLDLSGNLLTTLDLSHNPNLLIFNAEQNHLYYINAKVPILYHSSATFNTRYNAPDLMVCVIDSAFVRNHPSVWWLDSTATYTEICSNTTLLGHVRADDNNNCLPEAQELGLGRRRLTIAGTTDTFYTITSGQGFYTGELAPDTYQLTLSNEMPYRSNCLSNQMVTIDSIGDKDTVDWSTYTQVECAFLKVTMSAPFLRAAGGGSAYTIHYCNLGTADAYNAYAEVTLDHLLQVVTTSLPIDSQVGHVYTFDLDTIPQNTCGSFTIQVAVDPNAPIGATHCSEVHIYPDTLCIDDWTGPLIESTSNCIPDSVHFKLYNLGGNMLNAQTYSIFEDHVMLFTGPFTLGPGDSLAITYPSQAGKVYRIEATQAAGIPSYVAGAITHSTTFSCAPDATTGEWNMAAILQFYQDNSTPWVDVDCQTGISSYDPNDKAAQPIGYGAPHYITKGTDLSYKVRFQNTGTDTAFTVVIVDTLSPYLNPATLTITGSSHPYTWTLSGTGVLRMVFMDIKLVDSLTNEPLSHGFFTYEIAQKTTAALGAVIENTAAIYFDYNPPIFTNTTFHTLGENFYEQVVIKVDKVWGEPTQITVYPNPFSDQTTIEVKGPQTFQELRLEVVDVTGRIVEKMNTPGTNQILLSRKQLVHGLYLYRLLGDGQLIGTGKLQVR